MRTVKFTKRYVAERGNKLTILVKSAKKRQSGKWKRWIIEIAFPA